MDNYEEKYKAALGWMQSLYGGLHGATKEEAEKYFPELKESEDERIRNGIIALLKFGLEDNSAIAPGFNVTKEQALAWIEKQGEQKPFNYEHVNIQQKDFALFEPKFKVGDWIIDNEYGEVLKVTKADANSYEITRQDGEIFDILKEDVECNHRLWAIADAKDGDVLFHSDSASNGIFIFKEILQCGTIQEVVCYCDYDSEDGFCLGEKHTCCWSHSKILHPATKEQRDLLFQKMADAGYEFVNGHITRF